MKRPPRPLAKAGITLALLVGLGAVLGGTWAMYSDATANPGNFVESGTVELSDDDAGVTAFTIANRGAGATGEKCIRVTYSGTSPADVKLTASASSGALAPYVTLSVFEGDGGSSASCSGFIPATLINATTVAGFPTAYTSGAAGLWAPLGGTEARTYRLVYLIDPAAPLGTMDTSATIDLRWEARSASPAPLYSWGTGTNGRLGQGDTTSRATPTAVGTQTGWTQVAAGIDHSCAVKAAGTLSCWGSNSTGQLGKSPSAGDLAPTQVGTDSDWAFVSAGNSATCAIKISGALYCTGSNQYGKIGVGSYTSTFTRVGTDSDWRTVTLGADDTCAIKTGGQLYCWGSDNFNQLGNGAVTGDQASPMQVGTDTDWSAIATGQGHTCATKTTGALYCWGLATNGRLGNGSSSGSQASPVRAGTADDWLFVSAGKVHTCATRTSGALYCWGYGASGRLGSGGSTDLNVPTRVGTANDWASVAGGDSHSCGLKTSGELQCWGSATGISSSTPASSGLGFRGLAQGSTATHMIELRRPTP